MLFPLKKKNHLKWSGENRSSQAVLRSQSIWLKFFKVLIFCCFMVFKYIFIFYFQFLKILSFNWMVGYVGSNSMPSGWACTPALEVRSFKHWTTREVPCFYFILWENERIWLSYSNPQENWSQINYFWNREYKITTAIILQVNPSSLDHSCMCLIQSPSDAPLHWQETRVEIRRAWSYMCMSSHAGKSLWWGSVSTFLKERELSLNIFKRKERKRKRGKEKWMEGGQEKKTEKSFMTMHRLLSIFKKKMYVIWQFTLMCSGSFSCYIISSKVWIKYIKQQFIFVSFGIFCLGKRY